MVEHLGEFTDVEMPGADPAAGVSKIRKLEDEEDEIDKKIDDLLHKRKELMDKLAQLIAEENKSKLVDSGVQTATEEVARELNVPADDIRSSKLSSGRTPSKSASTGAGTEDGDLSNDPDASFERKKRKKTLLESLKSALSKAAKHIKKKTRRSRELSPDVTVDVGLKTQFGGRRASEGSRSESDRSEQNGDLSQELAELDALAGVAVQQKTNEQPAEVVEEKSSMADELAQLNALAGSAIEAAKSPTSEPLGVEGETGASDESGVGPLASELRGMLNQISNFGAAYDTDVSNTLPDTSSELGQKEIAVPMPIPDPETADGNDDVEESGASMLQDQLKDMLSQIGQLETTLTVTGAGEC